MPPYELNKVPVPDCPPEYLNQKETDESAVLFVGSIAGKAILEELPLNTAPLLNLPVLDAVSLALSSNPVSYTHLTLPTICSV